ncbi:NineTeen Complex (NTC) component, partial [Sarracenia purpurea var. burkii]
YTAKIRTTKNEDRISATECSDLRKCEKWRIQIIREIARKVSQIQNAGLGEFRIRDLNDDINKLIREKGHWEAQIKELGGPDYARVGPRMLDHEGREVPGNRDINTSALRKICLNLPPPPRKTRGELMREIDADYYGYRDDDDGILIPIEEKEERRGVMYLPDTSCQFLAIENAVNRWKQRGDNSNEEDDNEEQDLYAIPETDEEARSNDDASENSEAKFVAHVSVPSQDEIKAALLFSNFLRRDVCSNRKFANETVGANLPRESNTLSRQYDRQAVEFHRRPTNRNQTVDLSGILRTHVEIVCATLRKRYVRVAVFW